MCLVKVREEEDVVVPYRRVTHVRTRSQSPPRRRVSRVVRDSRTEVIREARPSSSSFIAVPAPKTIPIPAPQPVPVFVEPPPPPPPAPSTVHSSHHAPSHVGYHHVEVSPRSSVTNSPRSSAYVVHEREVRRERRGRERDYSPESSPRYEHFRYVEPAPEPDHGYERYERRRSRARSRSASRDDYGYDPRGSYRETRERIVISEGDGRRRNEYRR